MNPIHRQVEIPMAKIKCENCGFESFVAHIYDKEYYMNMICSNCNKKYLIKEEVDPNGTEFSIKQVDGTGN